LGTSLDEVRDAVCRTISSGRFAALAVESDDKALAA